MTLETAFPLDGHSFGMTLRDYLAAKALSVVPDQTAYNMQPNESHEKYMARRAYALADAMLKERMK